jgi:very-short-patch-repair endonuclease
MKGVLDQYAKTLDIVGENLYRDGWFQSSDEILVALGLIRKGLKIRHQVKMGRWKVDFIIPDLKVVLEVDGILFHPKEIKKKERARDAAIIAHLEPEWELIRITDQILEKNIQKLVSAIKKIKAERQRLRKSFDGKLS